MDLNTSVKLGPSSRPPPTHDLGVISVMSKHRLLDSEGVVELAQHITVAIQSASGRPKAKPPRSGCSQIALQVLLVGYGLRRAALVDALGLTAAQASAICQKLDPLSKQTSDDWAVLREVRLLHHAATSQTFIVSTRQSLWSDIAHLSEQSQLHQESYPALWVDARSSYEHKSPTIATPDPHIKQLVQAVYKSVQRSESGDVLVVSRQDQEGATAQVDAEETELVGVALAGLLLEYGAIYRLHDVSSVGAADQYRYDVRPVRLMERPLQEESFSNSPPNCLGSQPLLLYRVIWSHSTDTMELLAFSVPQCLSSDANVQQLREALTTTFQARLSRISSDAPSAFAQELTSGSVTVDLTTVTLPQVAL